jgi:hypothetical protein
MLVAAACSYDFDQFQYAVGTDGGPAGAPDGTAETDEGVSAVDVVTPPVDAPSALDSSGHDDADPGTDAGGADDAGCANACTTAAKTCAGMCAQTLTTCTAACPTGNPGKPCRQACQMQSTQCTGQCVTTCESCATGAGCSDPSGCKAATQ